MTPLRNQNFKKSKVLKNTSENEVGEGKQMAKDSNLSQGVPEE